MAEIIISGPVFTGAAPLLIDKACRDVELAVTAETKRRVKLLGQTSFRYDNVPAGHRPGYWLSQIRSHAVADHHEVTDSGVIYGHWLEGIGSRNRTTRFKGYFMWRRTLQSMQRSGAMNIAVPIIERAVRALNA